MMKRIYQYCYIKLIRNAMVESGWLKYLTLNEYKSNAAHDLLKGRITKEFYKSCFLGGTATVHYTEVNKEFIENYKF